MLEPVRAIYRESRKARDNFWNTYVSRPPAAVFVWLLRGTRVTPNQVTFLSLALFAGAAATLILWRSWPGLLLGAALVQTSYVFDCVDGQLARVKKMSSPVGAQLDFLMDELKAFLLVGSCAVRLWSTRGGDSRWLLFGIGGLAAAASGIALTTFMRRDEYLAATGGVRHDPMVAGHTATNIPRSPIGLAKFLVEAAGKLVLHYPTWFWLPALFDRLDLFLLVYLGAHGLYLGRASLTVLWKLGRFPKGPA